MAIVDPNNARELMATWQKEHDGREKSVSIQNPFTDLQQPSNSFFPEAIELLCQAVENGSFYKPMDFGLMGRAAIHTVLDAALKKRLENIGQLYLSRIEDGSYEKEDKALIQLLSECIKSGNLNKLWSITFEGFEVISENNVLISALATGMAPNLETIKFEFFEHGGACDVATQEALVQAIVNRKLPKLQSLHTVFKLHDRLPTLRVPEDFADKENEEILAFLQERWKYGEVQLATAKIIVTGPSAVGKTCLVNCLKGSAFIPDPGSTNAMEIGTKTEDGGLVLLFYDFGGQRVYSTSHQFFLQTSAVFLVVWDRQEGTGGDSAADQYARDVLDANPKAKIIFVTTKGDLEGHEPLSVSAQTELKERYGDSFRGYYDVSSKADTGMDELRAAIQAAAGFANVLMPKPYEELRRAVAKLGEKTNAWYVTRQEWDSLCEGVGIVRSEPWLWFVEKDHRTRALRLLRDMGEVVLLSTGHVVVKPSVLVGVLSRVLTANEEFRENARGGYLRHNELEEVWSDYPKELRSGFLHLIHDCDIGFPVHDEYHDYKATLIPAMMAESSGEEIRRGLDQLLEDNPGFVAGPEIVLQLSNLSNQLWSKLLVKFRDLLALGGWSTNGCIVVDVGSTGEEESMRSFGTVLCDSRSSQLSISTFGSSRSSVQLLRRRTLQAIGETLKSFPGVYFERFQMRSFSEESWSEEWLEEAIFRLPLDMSTFEKRGAPDIAEWLQKLREDRPNASQKQPREDSSFRCFIDMLQEDSGASDELLCYLLLAHQKEILKKGCERGRVDLSALWLIYNHNGSRMAYPFCPHLHPHRIRINKDMEVKDVSDVDLRSLNDDQIAVKALMLSVSKRLGIQPPRYKAEFLGILWHGLDEEYMFNVQSETRSKFLPVHVDGFEVFVHESDQRFFTSQSQVRAIDDLTRKAKESMLEMRKVPTIDGQCEWMQESQLDGGGVWHVRDGQCELIRKSLPEEKIESLSRGGPVYYVVGFFLVLLVVLVKRTLTRTSVFRSVGQVMTQEKGLQGIATTDASAKSSKPVGGHKEFLIGRDTEAMLFRDDPFNWLCENFCDGEKRKEHMEAVLAQTPIDSNVANAVKNKICELVKEDFRTFYPKVIISYSTGHREDFDVDCAGPGLIVAAAVINALFEKAHPCYSDIMTPAGRNWKEYMLRVEQANVMVVLMTKRLFRSVHCLREVYEALEQGVELVPVRCEDTSDNGIDIARDKDAMWPDDELLKYTQQLKKNAASELERLKLKRFHARKALSTTGSLPAHGTLLSEPIAVDQLMKRVGELKHGK